MAFFSDFQYGFGSSQSMAHLLTVGSDRIARAFNRSGATQAVAIDISKAFGMLVFFTNLSLMEFQVRYLTLLPLFSVIDNFKWFWMKSLHKNIQLMLEFLKALFLVLHFSCYILETFLMIILLSIISTIRHLICGNNLNWLLNLKLIYKTLWTGVRSDLLTSTLGKLGWFCLNSLMTMVLLM